MSQNVLQDGPAGRGLSANSHRRMYYVVNGTVIAEKRADQSVPTRARSLLPLRLAAGSSEESRIVGLRGNWRSRALRGFGSVLWARDDGNLDSLLRLKGREAVMGKEKEEARAGRVGMQARL